MLSLRVKIQFIGRLPAPEKYIPFVVESDVENCYFRIINFYKFDEN